MKHVAIAALAAVLMGSAAHADVIKVGVVGPFSGPFALQVACHRVGKARDLRQILAPSLIKAKTLVGLNRPLLGMPTSG